MEEVWKDIKGFEGRYQVSNRNLEWCDCSYNVLYSLKLHPERIEKIKEKRKRKNGYKRKNEPYKYKSAVIQKTINGEEIRIFKNTREACKEMNFNQSPILECCKGNRKTAYGYKWKFAE